MKINFAILALALTVATEASYIPYSQGVVSYVNQWPLRTSTVWPAYGGLYGKTLLPEVAVSKYGYSGAIYGDWSVPVYGKTWGYSAPVVASPTVKVVDNGLWNYAGYGYGSGYNKYWL